MSVRHFLYICLLTCEGKFFSHHFPKVPGPEWMHNACLLNEWVKTVKIMNKDHPESCIQCQTKMGQIHSEDGGSLQQQILMGWGRPAALGEGISSTVHSPSSDTDALARWYLSIPGDLQRTGLRVLHRIPSIIAPCFQAIPRSHFPVLSVTAPSPLCA